MDYTNKIVLFTEENFGGDALVIMRKLDVESKLIDPTGFDLFYSKGGRLDNYQRKCRSIISEKGFSELTFSAARSYTGAEYESNMPDLGSLTAMRFDYPSEIDHAVHDKRPPGSLVREDYNLTFYPQLNAYFISPAPPCELINKKFRWLFDDQDILTIHWVAESIAHAYLEFFSHDESGAPSTHRDRALPIEVLTDAGWKMPLPQYAIKQAQTIMLPQNKNGALWEFNFCCFTTNGDFYTVDPETKRGTGTGKVA